MKEVEVARDLIKESLLYNPYSDKWTLQKHYSVTTEQPAFQTSNNAQEEKEVVDIPRGKVNGS